MSIVIYARKSSESEDRQVQSLDDQVRILLEFATKEGMLVRETIVESKSAKSPGSRPEFQRLIEKIERGEITGILTWSINRLSRNLVDGGLIAYLLQIGKLQFIRTPERIYRPEDNVLIMSIENGMATSFVQDLSRNVKRGLLGKCERGWYPGSAPIGYRNNLSTHEIEPDPERFDLVRRAWDLILSGGYTVAQVHREIARLGLRGNQRATREKPISKSTLYKLLTSPFYAGEFDYLGQRYAGRQKPMVTKEEFGRAQQLLGHTPTIRKGKHDLAFAGVFRCGHCGCGVVGEIKRKYFHTTGTTRTYTYYHCSGSKGCPKISIKEEAVYELLERLRETLSIDQDFIDWCESALRQAADEDQRALGRLGDQDQQRREVLEARSRSLAMMRADGELTAEEYGTLRNAVSNELDAILSRSQQIGGLSERINRRILSRVRAAKRLEELRDLRGEVLRATLQTIGQNHLLTLGNLHLDVDPVLQKIATFEPLRNGSGRPERGDVVRQIPSWQCLVNDLRKLARESLLRELAS